MFLKCAIFFIIFTQIYSFNIDTNSPIVYLDHSPQLSNKSSYFGYSISLYPEKKINPAGIYIGAPRAADPKVAYQNPGAIFACETPGTCHMITLDQEPETVSYGSIRYTNKLDNAWIGGSMDINLENERLATCGYRWININKRNRRGDADYFMEGSCYWWHLYDNATQKLVPLIQPGREIFTDPYYKKSTYYYAQGQFGFSIHMPNGRNEVLVGAPGVYNWHGTPVLYSDSDSSTPIASKFRVRNKRLIESQEFAYVNIANAVHTSQVTQYNLLGYSSTSGHFYSKLKSKIVYVSGAPKGAKYQGQVVLYEFAKGSDAPLNVLESKQGTQFGEYFGSALTAGDINNDGYDDLIVGAPFYEGQKYNEGRIYVFLGSGNGRLEVPFQGKTISGRGANGQFGTTLQYLGDLNEDGFGDVAVSAPYEKKCGVVYIFRGTKNGLDVEPTQRIIGKDISSEITGFGISIAKPVDVDSNGHKDLAIGAHLSGEAILLRTGPTVTIYHNLESFSSRLDFTQTSFVMKACFTYKMKEADVGITIRRLITVDDKLNRAVLSNGKGSENFTVILLPNSINCQNFTVNLKHSISNRYDPITVTLDHQLVSKKTKKEVVYIKDNNMIGTDRFCIRCPFYNKYESSQLVTVDLPFTLGCKLDNVCKSVLEFDVTLSNAIDNDNTFVLGSTNYVKLKTNVKNQGERAYLTQLIVSIPEIINFRQVPSFCSELNISSITCAVDNPLEQNAEKSVTLELDMTNVNSGKYDDDSLEIFVNILTSSDNRNENFKTLEMKLKREADITISGKSGEQSYSYGNVTLGRPNFTQIFQVEKFGISLINEVQIEIEIPYQIETGDEVLDFLWLYPPTGNLGGQPITCRSNFTYLSEDKRLDDAGDATDLTDNNFLIDESTKVKRYVRQVEVFNNQSTMKKENLAASNEFDILRNRTFYINCSMSEVVCSKVVCNAGPFKSGQIAAIELKMLADIKKFKKLLSKGKDVVLISTRGFVYIQRPKNFVQDGDRPDSVHVSTVFVGDSVESKVALWIIILAVIAGLLLLLLLILGLIKAGFFKRTTKDELELLKKQAKEKEINELDDDDMAEMNEEAPQLQVDVDPR